MTIDEITEELKTCDDPLRLSEFLTYLAGWASHRNEQMKKVQLVKPDKWLWIQNYSTGLLDGKVTSTNHISFGDTVGEVEIGNAIRRTKPLSDKKTDMTWFATEDGQKEIALAYELKRILQMSSAIKQRLYAQRVDFRNLNTQI